LSKISFLRNAAAAKCHSAEAANERVLRLEGARRDRAKDALRTAESRAVADERHVLHLPRAAL
jgi:hypothetical protein